MSSELLINFDKSDTKKISAPNSNIKQNNGEKKEGSSLFDSLMNEAKNDSSVETKEDSTKQTKNEVSQNTKEDVTKQSKNETSTETKQQLAIKTEAKPESKNKEISTTETTKTQNNSDKEVNTSLKKMIDKLVDIIVSSAKEIKETKSSQNSLQSEVVKDKINQLLASKNIDSSKMNELKNEVNNIIKEVNTKDLKPEIIKNAVSKVLKENSLDNSKIDITDMKEKINIIKESIESISTKNKDISSILENKVVPESKKENDSKENTSAKEKLEIDKNEIKSEVLNIKNNLKELQKNIEKIPNEEVSSSKENINKNLKNIDKTSEDISSEISKIKVTQSDKKIVVEKNVKEIPQKIEYQVETLKENISKVDVEISKIIIVKTTEDSPLEKGNKVVNNSSSETINKDSKNPLLATMFLQSQNSNKETTSLSQIKDAKDTILNKKTVESVKESAKKLDLGLEETDVKNEGDSSKKVIETEPKKDEFKNNNASNRFLNQALLNQKIDDRNKNVEDLRVMQQQKELVKSIDAEIESKKEKTNIVELTVPRDVIQNLQTKIIGAQQKMSGFMSEVARNMYLNYKPPVTAFRVNLNPANLGSISVIMRATKMDNSLSVSMNLSNSNTMESFVENKALLQNAIQRQFNETSNITIDFGMQNQNSENGFNQFNQNNNQNNKEKNNDDVVIENAEEEQEIVENNDYM